MTAAVKEKQTSGQGRAVAWDGQTTGGEFLRNQRQNIQDNRRELGSSVAAGSDLLPPLPNAGPAAGSSSAPAQQQQQQQRLPPPPVLPPPPAAARPPAAAQQQHMGMGGGPLPPPPMSMRPPPPPMGMMRPPPPMGMGGEMDVMWHVICYFCHYSVLFCHFDVVCHFDAIDQQSSGVFWV